MPRFEVSMTRSATEHARITVEAETEDDAARLFDIMDDMEEIRWNCRDVDYSEPIVREVK